MTHISSEKRLDYARRYREENKNIIKQKRDNNKDVLHKQYKDWATNNRGKRNESHRKYRHSLKGRFTEIKKKSIRDGRVFILTFKEYCEVVVQPCYYCNNEFGQQVIAGSGLDRIDSSIGYQFGNVVSCCKNCNTVKSNLLTMQEMKTVISVVLEMRKVGPVGVEPTTL